MKILGIDIGGSGIKGGIVNTKSGKLVSQKIRFETPSPSSPKRVIKKIKKNIIKELDWNKYVGCGFPGIVNKNKILSAANVSNKWVGVDVSKRISRKTGCESFVLNDADAAGLAEMKYDGDNLVAIKYLSKARTAWIRRGVDGADDNFIKSLTDDEKNELSVAIQDYQRLGE